MRLYLELPSWASWLHRPLDLLALPLLYLVILPFTAAYHILLSLLYGIPHEWELRHYLYLNLRRVGSQYGSYRRLPPVDPEEDVLPARAEMYLPKCEYMRVTCPPMSKEVPRVGVLQTARAVVQDKDDLLAPAEDGERIIYFIVGGGYIGGHPYGSTPPGVNYRKSLSASSAFPGSLIDCLAGYQYLVRTLGVSPSNITLNGDSAGANACMALARYLSELEGCGWSDFGMPWSDMSSSFASIRTNRYTDHLPSLLLTAIPSHTRHFPSRANPYFSPALTPRIQGGTHSEFVWVDRGEIDTMGFSWPVIREDFATFWAGSASASA
ncbi:hypothetical protein EHS25_009360 [Saitozyma podzolica]|uniref:Alpha/beta hydrolase fold-3 domain-containing protein n=1 Tax=Saitozyma podzolica TaxID=1890683 RepID=A0A427YLR0_9TREE|nr:hypothetical protein EHS25_009360 [Saitozyma podzolica]